MPITHLLGRQIEVVRRPYQRRISLSVRPNGHIRITANKSASEGFIRQFLRETEPWLKKTLADYEFLRQKYPAKKYRYGEEFLYLGTKRKLMFRPTNEKKIKLRVDPQFFIAEIPKEQWSISYLSEGQPTLKNPIMQFYKKAGSELLTERVKLYSTQMNLIPKSVRFRSQKTRWGSCNSEGSISLNWRLIAAPLEVIDYVVVHELAHLRHQNHSARFWQLVQQFSPNHKAHRRWLRENQYEFDFLAKVSEIHPQNTA